MIRNRRAEEYYLGLDMGTSSVGWAVTDKEYHLLRVKGKDLWGIREFEEADTAAERRMHRISRRRRQREVVRIGLVKDIFHEALSEKDPYFLQRLDNSKYHLEDKDEQVRYRYGIFNDKDYTDADYYKQYPTIYHLRQELIHDSKPHDVRLVYLAVINLFKHRGHFLNSGVTAVGSTMGDAYRKFCDAVNQYLEASDAAPESFFESSIETDQLETILGNRNFSRTEKAEQLQKLFQTDRKQKQKLAFLKLICGLSVDLQTLFTEVESEEKTKVCFADYNYDEKYEEFELMLNEECVSVIQSAKGIYDIGTMSSIMRGYLYLSDARVADYEKHGEDLKKLKKAVQLYAPQEYNRLFRSDEGGTYGAYVNSTNSSGEKNRRNMKSRRKEDLYKTIRTVLKNAPENDEIVKYIRREMETETFLPKQLTSSNGVIPNQIHLEELKKILENAQSYLPFLSEQDESGLTAKERLQQLFSFQIPYYVGPTSANSENDGRNGWVVRRKAGPVLPWTIQDTIDLQKTSERFIERLIRQCTYISDEKVLPKSSLKYEKFSVLNEINNLRINGEKISVGLKQSVYHDLFETGKKITRKKLAAYLLNRGLIEEDEQLTGIDKQINNSLSSYGRFHALFGERMQEDRFRMLAEEVVFWGTVYGDDRKSIIQNIHNTYGDMLTEDQIRRISGFRFQGWGRLSEAFLQLQGCYKPTGEVMSLLEALWSDENNSNLMELLHSDLYTFGEELQRKQTKGLRLLDEFTYDDLADTYFSPPVKRMVWQTLLIIRELKQILGCEPSRVFIEMTRTDAEKGDAGRKDSRRKQLETLYKKISTEKPDWKKEMLNNIAEADSNGKLRSKKMYLYFTQMGKCMYTGRSIDLGNLFNDNLYDIDHIYPRHYVKDDNINNNLVLVYKPENARKSDAYPIEDEIRNNTQVKALWESLKKQGLITEEKYRRLTGTKPFTDNQLAGFIARQMVETSQGTKGVADLLRQLLHEEADIVYAKAGNISDFRHRYDLLKSRTVNDFHHAHDAYLNIVIGNSYFVKFTRDPRNYISNYYSQDREKYRYHLDRMFESDIRRGNEIAWIAEHGGVPGTIGTVKKTLARNTPLLTRMSFIGHGGIADQTLYGKDKAKPGIYIPLKSSDPKMADVKKYGGFASTTTAYFFLVEHGEEGKRIRTLETVPVYLKKQIDKSEDTLRHYCEGYLQLINPSIRLKKIPIQALVKRNGYLMHLSGKTGNRIISRNAVSLCLNSKWTNYIHDIDRFIGKGLLKENLTNENNSSLYRQLIAKHQEGIYRNRPNPVGTTLATGVETFERLSVEDQLQVLNQVIQLTRIGTVSGDLTLIGGAAKSGIMLISKRISGCEEFWLIHQSVTGIYEKKIDLLTV